MKKTLSVILAIAMIFALTTVAFAADELIQEEGNGTAEQEVTASFDAEKKVADNVYYVNVTWKQDSNSLTYSEGTTTYVWDGAAMKYGNPNNTGKGWSGTAQYTVTVSNQSNAEITATAEWDAADDIVVNCTFNGNDGTPIDAATEAKGIVPGSSDTGEAVVAEIVASIDTPKSGEINQSNTKVGTITVTIAPVK